MKIYKSFFKPFSDLIISFGALLVLSPLLIIATILLFWSNKGNPFFVQKRPGKNGEIFKIVKFKTMTDEKDSNGILLPDSQRLTGVGKFIRKTSLDELPQLWNVLKGEMSIIGPRPLLPQYLPIYTASQYKRHNLRPGITGWAQVNGRNAISWTQKFEYDVWYVQNVSFLVDMKILFKTVRKVLVSEGINAENMATTEPFNGNN
ncbi:lipopolysaccharide/colanic/teichoic acid biosynthesis glycosyltransferase [Gillisia mitskevichiae]|uniref:Lipopolysaccharide/colanic/teichoic acid biosynthesis glycosyltransferase n=1 Tax=Gillisia mitskevichiae TaxID=270921 RepID=A0A495PM94_9FLAO|nr:lipopolysaccharide/colanic/teichoic acid biosynthesis glycosyltransferase [Gillisia mitskevichiae]